MYTHDIEMDIRRREGRKEGHAKEGPPERAPSSAAAFSFIMDKTQKARKEGRKEGWPNALSREMLLAGRWSRSV